MRKLKGVSPFLVIVLVTGTAERSYAQPPPGRTSVEDFTRKVESLGSGSSEAGIKITNARDGIAIVFVPGILGTRLIKNRKTIWGEGSPSAQELALPRSGDPGVEVKGLDQYPVFFGLKKVDIYGEFSRDAEQARNGRGVFREFPYDWRQDIRKIARDFDDFLRTDPPLKGRPIIIIAHSMGGLVTWYWQHRIYQGDADPLAVTRLLLLGSPLNGSCEVIRLLVDGYQDIREASKVTNFVYGLIFNDLRAAAFTFPSVFQLLPRVPTDPNEIDKSCLQVPLGDRGEDIVAGDYFKVAFWKSQFGMWLLERRAPPWKSLTKDNREAFFEWLTPVLEAGEAFRRDINLDQLKIPTVFFYAQRHPTTGKARTAKSGGNFSIEFPFGDPGDGRVPVPSAKNEGRALEAERQYKLLGLTHGDLPKDATFITYLGTHLAQIVLAHVVLAEAKLLLQNETLLDQYVREGGRELSVTVVAAEVGQRLEKEVRDTVAAMNQKIRERLGVSLSYSGVRSAQQRIPDASPALNRDLVPALEAVVADPSAIDPFNRPFALGRLGWALVAGKNYKAALGPLTEAYRAIPTIPPQYDTDERVILFKRNTPANLGIAFFKLGRCQEAKSLLVEGRARGNSFAGSYLGSACVDQETGKRVVLDPTPPSR